LQTFLDDITKFPAVVIIIVLSSIASTELFSIMTLIGSYTFKCYGKFKKIISLLLFPLIPAIVLQQQFQLELEQLHIIQILKCNRNNKNLHYINNKREIKALLLLRSNLKANENVFEQFPQLIILLLILILRISATPNVVQMDKIFLNNNVIFVFISTGCSFVSLIKGQLFFIKATKNTFVTTLGQLILLLYFAIGMLGRLMSIVLLFTPILGLFDTNYHGVLGNITSQNAITSKGDKLNTLFDYTDNNNAIFFEETWQKFSLKKEGLYHIPSKLFLFMFSTIYLHLVLGFMMRSKAKNHCKEGIQNIICKTLYTLLSPPLFLDWEEIFRAGKGSITFKDSWKKSQKFLVSHIFIHFIEHIVLCIPLMLLKLAIDNRNKELLDLFHPLDDELYSTFIVNLLLAIGITLAFVLPLIQYALARLYFVKGHPWSRLMNAKLTSK
jgi:hypothetical protein